MILKKNTNLILYNRLRSILTTPPLLTLRGHVDPPPPPFVLLEYHEKELSFCHTLSNPYILSIKPLFFIT